MAAIRDIDLELLVDKVRAPKLVFNYLFRGLEGDEISLRKAERYFEARDTLANSLSLDYNLCRQFLEVNSRLYGDTYYLFDEISDEELDLVFGKLREESLERTLLYEDN